MKDYLGYENARNKHNAALYERLIKAAIKADSIQVLVGHHITFELNGDLETENEIASADCLMFDHDIMTRVFGNKAIPIMRALATVGCGERDQLLGHYLDSHQVLQFLPELKDELDHPTAELATDPTEPADN